MTPDPATCLLTHRHQPDRPRRAVDGLYLCRGHLKDLEQLIDKMPARYDELGRMLGATSGAGQRVSGSQSEPLPINPTIVDHRDLIRHALIWWCVYVAEQRGVNRPASGEPVVTAAWLGAHAQWLAADRPAAEECQPVMQQLASTAWSLVNPDGRKRIKVGPCCAVAGDEECAGTLFATVRAEDDPRPSVIYCDTCDLKKTSIEWLRFSRQYIQQMSA